MTVSQQQLGEQFAALHRACFVIPNPWDAGSARILERLGFRALAGTSAGYAFSIGRRDMAQQLSREEMLGYLTTLVTATALPVSADLEHGYGAAPEEVAQTIRLAAATGVVGGSIEDVTGDPGAPLYPVEQAAERIAAAAEAKAGLPFQFTLTARAENYLLGRPDLADTIRRLQRYQEAGADVLYAPGLQSAEDIRSVVNSVDRPVNVVMGLQGVRLSVIELAALGVKRISVGSSMARAAYGALIAAATEIGEHGTFTFADGAVPFGAINDYFR